VRISVALLVTSLCFGVYLISVDRFAAAPERRVHDRASNLVLAESAVTASLEPTGTSGQTARPARTTLLEPASLLLLGAGLCAVGWRFRRRRS
jgi:hypothetical protein